LKCIGVCFDMAAGEPRELRVKPIKNGTVIDHIAGGQALNVLKILGIGELRMPRYPWS